MEPRAKISEPLGARRERHLQSVPNPENPMRLTIGPNGPSRGFNGIDPPKTRFPSTRIELPPFGGDATQPHFPAIHHKRRFCQRSPRLRMDSTCETACSLFQDPCSIRCTLSASSKATSCSSPWEKVDLKLRFHGSRKPYAWCIHRDILEVVDEVEITLVEQSSSW